MLSDEMITKIEKDFNDYVALFPLKIDEIKNIANLINLKLRAFFMKAVTQMPATDIITVDFADVFKHVAHIYHVVTSIEYCEKIPDDIVLNYVLPYRVNDEDFSLYSTYFYKDLGSLINEKNILKSALEVNYWCYSKATYAQADDRTQNAMTTVRAGKGRCGEESVLLVSALRSVGIPARQCYSPYWSHCDDNHAWVEVFTGEKWEFMGACEPEEKLNIGWFNNASSRALAVRHRRFQIGDRQANHDQNKIFTTEISTSMYVETRHIDVKVIFDNKIIPNAKVGIYIINYCMPKLVLEKCSDEKGHVAFEVGRGDFLLFTYVDGKYAIKTCLKNQSLVVLDLSQNIEKLEFNLVPYQGDISNIDFESSALHKEKMLKLLDKRVSSHKASSEGENRFIQLAGLNKDEIQKFLSYSLLNEEIKNEILSTLTKKDFADITFEDLLDMSISYAYKNLFTTELFNKYILPLRVENEPIYKYKKYIKDFFADKNINTPIEVVDYISSNIKLLDAYTYTGLVGDVKGVLENKIATTFSIPIHLVQILRALGIPARLNPLDREVEYYNGEDFASLYEGKKKSSIIKLIQKSKKNLVYGNDYTACKIENGYFKYLNMSEQLNSSNEVCLDEGLYVITQARRQIDGSVIGNLEFCLLNKYKTMTIAIDEPRDNTKEKLKSNNIDTSIINENGKIILGYIENGCEPTEHFLNELLENEKQIKSMGVKVVLKGDSIDKNNILTEIIDKNIGTYTQAKFTEEWKKFRKDMGIGDLRLPFISSVLDKKALFSFANYNVGTVEMLLKILETK